MSYADDDLFEEPVEAPARPTRRSGGGGGSSRGPRAPRGGNGASPLQQPRIRALIALGLLVIVALILISTIRGCQRNRLVDSYKSYLTGANAIATESENLGKTLQSLLDNKQFNKRAAIVAQVGELATKSADLVTRAKKLKPPDALSAPNRTLVTALEYRALGLSQLPDAITAAVTAKDQQEAATTIAAPLQLLATSDVILRTSYKLPTENAIQKDKIKDIQVVKSELFPGNTYDKTSLSGAVKVIANIKQARPSTNPVTGATGPGNVHGLSISSVFAVRGGKRTQLSPGSTTPLVTGEDLTFQVTVENGGDFNESNIDVSFTYVTPNNPAGTVQKTTIPEIAPGAPNNKVLSFSLGQTDPYLTSASSIVIEVATVPEEKVVSNNKVTYPVEFNLQ